MNPNKLDKIIIVGGGTAGWMAAASLAHSLRSTVPIELIESDEIGTVGVGEATIPSIKLFNKLLGINESDFLRETEGSIKLGIQFNNWGQLGDSYYHAFGGIGMSMGMVDFHQYWLKAHLQDRSVSLWDYSLNAAASDKNVFAPVEKLGNTRLEGLAYAYHFDATLYARYLRKYAERLGVTRIEGKIVKTNLREADGFIQSVSLADGQEISGDLFIDCSGFRGLLIEEALQSGYEDWSHWLPCDRALAVPSASAEEITPYTKATAHSAGWQWRIPLQHRTGNGHVFCSQYMSDDEACSILLENLDGEALAEPRLLKFKTGRRKKIWNKNCVALGLSSGFIEPLESTSIHLIQNGIGRLLDLFPDKSFREADINEYNNGMQREFERIRDFIILHYYANQRTDSEFWLACRKMDIPEKLTEKINLFKTHGRIFRFTDELFSEVAWLQVMTGQNILPETYHPMADILTDEQLSEFLKNIKTIINKAVTQLPSHRAYINQQCKITE